jgi:hypothetical protein
LGLVVLLVVVVVVFGRGNRVMGLCLGGGCEESGDGGERGSEEGKAWAGTSTGRGSESR